MKFLFLFFLLSVLEIDAQKPEPVIIMDFVRVKEGRFAEALFFYRNNWKLYRDEALRKGFITGFRIVETTADSLAAFNLILITEYADSVQQANSEKNFEGILKALRPNGPVYLNGLRPADFRDNLYYRVGREMIGSPGRER